jgi:hypothetical protein
LTAKLEEAGAVLAEGNLGVYAKSLLAGMVALIAAALIAGVILFGGPILKSFTNLGGDTGVFVVRFYPLPTLGLALLVFAAGFYWEYRRAVKQSTTGGL